MDPSMTPTSGSRQSLRLRTPIQMHPFTHRPENSRSVFNNPADAAHAATLSETADSARVTAMATAATLASQEDQFYYDQTGDEDEDSSCRCLFGQ